jgi:hypothetical protein
MCVQVFWNHVQARPSQQQLQHQQSKAWHARQCSPA